MILNQEELEGLADLIRQYAAVKAAFLFGSIARNTARPDSDIDIALLTDTVFSTDDLIGVSAQITALLGRKADVVVLNSATSLILRDEVARDGLLLFTRDERASNTFIIKAPQMLMDFMKTRGPLEENYVKGICDGD